MDDIVRQAIAKWPNVPDCYGWLGLGARGDWYLRDAAVQAAGAFQSGRPGSKGDLLRHDKLLSFIARNYEHDAQGRWFFQNGPQRVYVELEVAPWVCRLAPDGSVALHTGQGVHVDACLLDEQGRLFLQTERGLALVHSLDVELAATAIEQGRWSTQDVQASDLPACYGFVMSPQSNAAD